MTRRRILIVFDPLLGHITVHARGRIFQSLFEQHGWSVEFISRRPDVDGLDAGAVARRERELVRRSRAVDVVYLLKVSSLALVRKVRESSRARIVFDLSDSLWRPIHQDRGWQDLDEILRCVDAVFCENAYVAEYGRKLNSAAFVIPDCVPIHRFDEYRSKIVRDPTKVVLGWVGSDGTVGALAACREAIESVSSRHPNLELRILGYENVQPLPKFRNVRCRIGGAYGEDEMVREVLAMDVGLYPPPFDLEDYEARGPFKATIYMAGGIPVLCQNAGDCARIIRDGVNGMLAVTQQEWTDRLEQLIQSAGLRRELGLRGLATVRDAYSPESVFRTLEESLLAVLEAPRRLPPRSVPAVALPGPAGWVGRRVVVVLEHLQMGGAERQVLALVRYLVKECGARVEVWGLCAHGGVSRLLAERGIPCRVVPLQWSWSRACVLKNLLRFGLALRGARPDVILPYTRLPNIVCGLVWRWTGARLCVWNQRDGGMGLNGCRTERQAIANTPLVISNSGHAARMLVARYALPLEKVAVVPNGIEVAAPKDDRATWRARLGVGADDFMACMVANLHEYKDHDTLVDAWAHVARELPARTPRRVLVLAGRDGGRMGPLKCRAFDLKLSGHDVLFPGQVDDVAGLLAAADLGVFSSRLEGLPNGILECMEARLPIVATDIDGIREAVGDDYPYLCPAGDGRAFAAHVRTMIEHPEVRADMARQLKERVTARFSVSSMGRGTIAAMERTLDALA